LESHEYQVKDRSPKAEAQLLFESEDLERYQTGLRRFFAGILDSIFISIIAAPFALIIGLLTASVGKGDVEFIIGTIYIMVLTGVYGKTLGKHLCKVRVVSYPGEGKIGMRESVLREIFPVIMVVLLLPMNFFWEMTRGPNPIGIAWGGMLLLGGMGWNILEIGTYLMDPKRRAFHDKIAGTVVVKTGRFEFGEKSSL
jgi:uncharacterized RDD family membrane protein YckC